MAFLAGLVCVILIVVFWRIFLPLALVLIALLVGAVIYFGGSDSRQREEAKRQIDVIKGQIAAAQRSATPKGKHWTVGYEPDPASQTLIARSARIQSNDKLCNLSVQQRIDGVRLTALSCAKFRIPSHHSLEVKFDNLPTS